MLTCLLNLVIYLIGYELIEIACMLHGMTYVFLVSKMVTTDSCKWHPTSNGKNWVPPTTSPDQQWQRQPRDSAGDPEHQRHQRATLPARRPRGHPAGQQEGTGGGRAVPPATVSRPRPAHPSPAAEGATLHQWSAPQGLALCIDRCQIDTEDNCVWGKWTHTYHCCLSSLGITQTWEPHERLPSASVRELLTRYLDITTPPTSNFLHVLAEYAHDNDERTRLDQLATVHCLPFLHPLFLTFMSDIINQYPFIMSSTSSWNLLPYSDYIFCAVLYICILTLNIRFFSVYPCFFNMI